MGQPVSSEQHEVTGSEAQDSDGYYYITKLKIHPRLKSQPSATKSRLNEALIIRKISLLSCSISLSDGCILCQYGVDVGHILQHKTLRNRQNS